MRWIALVLVVFPCACADDSELQHDIVKLDLAHGATQESGCFQGTMQVFATLEYGDCLVSFYEDNQNLRQDGPDGASVFGPLADGGEGWMDRLCGDRSGTHAQCEVISIRQDLDTLPPRLTVVYAIGGPLQTRQLDFGPLPNAETSNCAGDSLPIVRMGSVSGVDENGDTLWATETFDPSSAVVGQGGAITIYASSPD